MNSDGELHNSCLLDGWSLCTAMVMEWAAIPLLLIILSEEILFPFAII